MRIARIAVALSMLGSSALLADDGWRVRLQAGYVTSISDLTTPGFELGADDALGVRLSFEQVFHEKLGLELGISTSEHEFTSSYSPSLGRGVTSEFRMTPITAIANWHFREDEVSSLGEVRRVDPFVGGGLAYVLFGGLSGGSTSSSDEDLTWVAQFGLDVRWTRRWGLGLAVLYLGPGSDLGVETISVYAGASIRR
jgi:outer membrane protein W